MLLRYGLALIAVLLVLFLVVRPVMKMVTGRRAEGGDSEGISPPRNALVPMGMGMGQSEIDREQLSAQIELAQRIVREQPDDALRALRRMLSGPREIDGATR
jgi:flagellar M-ring protein FliF